MKKPQARALMVLGTASHVGKSITVAALCRIFHQDSFDVAPFKAQNMALNSFATASGHEIGRAQAVQAEAACLEPHVDMNPILLKPSAGKTQVVLNGRILCNVTQEGYPELKSKLRSGVAQAYERLASLHDFIILEGAGSPVEMNLKDDDIANLKMAEIADARCILVADIDRGGVFASLVGTYQLLKPEERARFGGFIINKFRGDMGRFGTGVEMLEERLGQRCLGVIPFIRDLKIDEEDGVALDGRVSTCLSAAETDRLRICVVRLPHISNFSDFSALESSSSAELYYSNNPGDLSKADVIVLPGSKSTIPDVQWLKESGCADTIMAHANQGKPVIGICGGFQMLGRKILDPLHVESQVDSALGLGLLDSITSLDREKITRQARATLLDPAIIGETGSSAVFEGYEIHIGETRLGPGVRPLFRLNRLGEDGSVEDGAVSDEGRILGTYLHGLFDSANATRVLLNHLYRLSGKVRPADSTIIEIDRNGVFDELAAHFRQHLDVAAIYRLIQTIR